MILDARILLHTLRTETELRRFSLSNALSQYQTYRARARQRAQLAQLPEHLLKDIGISKTDALQEANKPFWQA